MGQRSSKKLKYFAVNENKKYNLSKYVWCIEKVYRGKFIALNVYIKKKKI